MDIKRAELKKCAKDLHMEKYWPFFLLGFIPYVGIVAFALVGLSFFVNIFFVSPFWAAYSKFITDNSKNDDVVDLNVLLKIFKENYVNLLKNTFMRDLFLMLWELPLRFGFASIITGLYLMIMTGGIQGKENTVLLWLKAMGFRELENLKFSDVASEQIATACSGLIVVGFFLMVIGFVVYYCKHYSYYMSNYVIGENPQGYWKENLSKSEGMMKKRKLFALKLDLSFVGWHLVSALVVSVLSLVTGPFSVFLMLIGYVMVSTYREMTVAQFYMHIKQGFVDGDEMDVLKREEEF